MTPQDAIEEIASISPPFGRLMRAFMEKNSLAGLLEQQEASDALDRLQDFLQSRQQSPEQDNALHLQLQPGSTSLSDQAKASLLTIARCIFVKESYVSSLDQNAKADLDELLDTLT